MSDLDGWGGGGILLAEDNGINARVAGAMLEHLGFRVDVVGDGAQAVEAATLTVYRAIFMDCQLPILDGFEATAEIRRRQGDAHRSPILAVTAAALDSDRERCLAAGMDDCLAKPLTMTTLIAALGRWVPDGSIATNAGDDPAGSFPAAAPMGPRPAGPTRPILDPVIVARLQRLGQAAGEDLVGQLAALFLADAVERVATLRRGLRSGDAAAVARSAHSLCGASASLGATDLARLCATLSTEGTAGDLTHGVALLGALEVELDRVRSALLSPALVP